MRHDSASRRARAQAHAKHGYFCACGRVVHGNGARAMHFYVAGDRYAGKREGHREISRERYFALHGHPLDHPRNRKRATMVTLNDLTVGGDAVEINRALRDDLRARDPQTIATTEITGGDVATIVDDQDTPQTVAQVLAEIDAFLDT